MTTMAMKSVHHFHPNSKFEVLPVLRTNGLTRIPEENYQILIILSLTNYIKYITMKQNKRRVNSLHHDHIISLTRPGQELIGNFGNVSQILLHLYWECPIFLDVCEIYDKLGH